MAVSPYKQKQKNRLKVAFTTVLISSSLLLFMLGMWVNIVVLANQFSQKIKEEMTLTVYVDPMAKPIEIKSFDKKLKRIEGVSRIEFVSKEKAAEQMKSEIDEHVLELLDFNPFFDAYDVYFNAEFVDLDRISKIETDLKKHDIVYKVTYDKSIILKLNKNIKTISLIVVILCSIFLFVAITLIYNSIRLAVHAQRFSIRTMQLVGASSWFVRKPFLWKSVLQGALSGLIAISLNYGALHYLNSSIPSFSFLSEINTFLLTSVVIFVFGIVLSLISTIFAMKRYLHANLSELYV
ncbi:MAG: cell division protein FtsX [Flavobacteriales bacterium]